ncbi:hypothetical protein BD779DRAFT_1466557 [Infundibulicybe gibba]|nr:hypothetical protein BD779DRAFT_1466557 [Infundibulicybe gibba]
MLFTCATTCGREFATRGALSTHQKVCQAYQQELDDMAHKRRSKPPKNTKLRKRARTNAPRAPLPEVIPQSPAPSPGPPPFLGLGSPPPPPSRLPTPPPPPPPLTQSGRPRRQYRIPARFIDTLPGPSLNSDSEPPPNPQPVIRCVILYVRDTMRTCLNQFSILREYPHRPSYDPDAFVELSDLADFQSSQTPDDPDSLGTQPSSVLKPPPWPFQNMTIYRLMQWATSGSNKKTETEITRLAKSVLCAPDFNTADLIGFDAHRENARLDGSEKDIPEDSPFAKDGWRETSVDINIPSNARGVPPSKFSIPGLHHRSLVEVIKTAFLEPLALHHSSDGTESCVYDELYTSDTWINAHNDLQKQPPEPGCKLERVIAGLMFWSDSTHLTNFGTAKVWPLYLYFGNLSKYIRAKPSSGACHHVAYIPSLPDSIGDFLSSFLSKPSHKTALLTHCRRELMHETWRLLLDDEFLHAYKHGIVLQCLDGIWRRIYPRIFTYSADYPENIGLFWYCYRDKLDRTGYKLDLRMRVSQARTYLWEKIQKARKFIYDRGYFELGVWKAILTHLIRVLQAAVPGGKAVSEFNLRFRQIPTFGRDTIRKFSNNAAEMRKLGARDFEDMLQNIIPVVEGLLPQPHNDRVMTMLFRLCEWHALAKLRLHTDATLQHLEMATTVMGSEVRGFRDSTRKDFATIELPSEVATRARRKHHRKSRNGRRSTTQTASDLNASTSAASGSSATALPSLPPPSAKSRYLNVSTYKFHALGDYARGIRLYGTTDSYSTQIVRFDTGVGTGTVSQLGNTANTATRTRMNHRFQCAPSSPYLNYESDETTGPRMTVPACKANLVVFHHISYLNYESDETIGCGVTVRRREAYLTIFKQKHYTILGELAHRVVKRFYDRTNKKNATKQIAKQERRATHLRRVREASTYAGNYQRHSHHPAFSDNDIQLYGRVDVHHHISESRNHSLHIFTIASQPPNDPAKKNFIPKLKDHILSRILDLGREGEERGFSDNQRNSVCIVNNRIFSVKTIRVNYTTYDMRRDQDVINPHTHPDIMMRSPETGRGAHPFWYARVLGIFHTKIIHTAPNTQNRSVQHFEFLWATNMVSNVPGSLKSALSPKAMMTHLAPAFVNGRTSELLNTTQITAARPVGEVDDWTNYYVIIFVDRDMFMRYFGAGIGHMNTYNNSVTSEDELSSDTPSESYLDGDADGLDNSEDDHDGLNAGSNAEQSEDENSQASCDSDPNDSNSDLDLDSDHLSYESGSDDLNDDLEDSDGDHDEEDGYGFIILTMCPPPPSIITPALNPTKFPAIHHRSGTALIRKNLTFNLLYVLGVKRVQWVWLPEQIKLLKERESDTMIECATGNGRDEIAVDIATRANKAIEREEKSRRD